MKTTPVKCFICEKEHDCQIKESLNGSAFYECPECGIDFAYPFKTLGSNYYEQLYGATGEGYGESKWEYEKFLADAEKLGIKGNLLEIGCGPGYFLQLAKQKGFDVYGIDFNKLAVEQAAKNGLEKVKTVDISDLPDVFLGIKFKAVVVFSTLEHCEHPSVLLKSINHLLLPGGIVAIVVPNADRASLKFNFRKKREGWDYPPHHLMRWNKNGLSKFLQKNGFSAVSVEEERVSSLSQTFNFIKGILQLMTTTSLVAEMKKNINQTKESNQKRNKLLLKISLLLSWFKKITLTLPVLILTPFLYLASKFILIKGTNLYVLAKKS